LVLVRQEQEIGMAKRHGCNSDELRGQNTSAKPSRSTPGATGAHATVGTVGLMSRALADRYVLGEPLGSGGSSRVHVAVDKRLDRRVAVKLLDSNVAATADPAARERFLREGRTTAAFNHRHAVTVFDAGEDDGDLYLVMELVDGPSLAELMARSGPLPIEQAVRIAAKVLSALAAAHAVGIVHRDVKPANILLGPNGAVKLADFGIAKRFDDLSASVTSTGMVVGTPRYLSPEQARGEAATPASDVYSMGVVLFEMLTGRQPFEGDAAIAIAVAQQAGPAPDVRSLRPEVPVALASVVAHALAAQPSARPATAAEMLTALTTARTTTMAVPSAPAAGAHRTTQAMPAAAVSRTVAAPASEPSTGRRAIMLFAAFIGVLGVVVAAAALTERPTRRR
jgi:serine/threonine-protein kinase